MVTLLRSLNDNTSNDDCRLHTNAHPLACRGLNNKRHVTLRQSCSSLGSKNVQARRAKSSTTYESTMGSGCHGSWPADDASPSPRLRAQWELRADGQGNLVLMRSDEAEPDQKDLKDIKIATYHLSGLVNHFAHSPPAADAQPSALANFSGSEDSGRDDSVEAEMPEAELMKEVVPQGIDKALVFLANRFRAMRQTPKKDITPLIISIIDPTKRANHPYSLKGDLVENRPDYWAPRRLCKTYTGPHHTDKNDLPNLLAWLVLLPFVAPAEAEDRLAEARKKRHYDDWSSIIEYASDEFEAKSKKEGPNGKAKVAAEARAFRDVAYLVRDMDISRDANDPLTIDVLPKLATKNNGGGASKAPKKVLARSPYQVKRLLTGSTQSGSDEASDTEEDDDDTVLNDRSYAQDDPQPNVQRRHDRGSCVVPPAKRAKARHRGESTISKTVPGHLTPNSLASNNDTGELQTRLEDAWSKYHQQPQRGSTLKTKPHGERFRSDGLPLDTDTSLGLTRPDQGLPMPTDSAQVSFSSVGSYDTDYTAMSQAGDTSSYPFMMPTPPSFEWTAVPTGGPYVGVYPFGNSNNEVPRSFRYDAGGVAPQLSAEQSCTRQAYGPNGRAQYY